MLGRFQNVCMLMIGLALLATTGVSHVRAEDLSKQWQLRVERRYREFEGSLEKLANTLRPTDPARADLLTKAFKESKKELVAVKLRELITQIEKGEIKQAASQQDQVIADMNEVLQLLLSEDRADRVEERRAKLEMYARQVQQLTDEQRQLRSSTEKMESTSADDIEKQQSRLAEKTKQMRGGDKLSEENPSMPANSREQENSSEENQDKGTTVEKKLASSDSSPSKSEVDGNKSQPKSSKSAARPGERREPNSPSAGEESKEEKEAASPPSMPGDDHLSEAEESMKSARQKILNKEKELALREQDKAIQELEKSTEELKKELEELRDEEKNGQLSDLEARLRQILEQEQAIYEGTLTLDKSAEEKRSRSDEQRGFALSRNQREVVGQLDQVLGILIADGTAVAFPETVEQLTRDGEDVAKRLAVCDTGTFTQHVEKDMIDSLSEMIQSLQRELGKKREENSPRKGESGNEDATKSPLVEELSELKMIRSLQHRINERTTALRQSKQSGRATSAELDRAVRDLADRQKRVYQITRDVARERTP